MDGNDARGDQDAPALPPGQVGRSLVALAQALRFYSRLPVPALPWEREAHAAPSFASMTGMVPAAGAIIGLVGALTLAAALVAGLGATVAAILAIAALTLATGALHEDGLADSADGFGGGRTPQRRLEIMKDSRLGSFGAIALILVFALRIAALAALADRLAPVSAGGALVLAAALSRSAALIPSATLPPARATGLALMAGRPTPGGLVAAGLAAAAIAILLWAVASLPASGIAVAAAAAVGVALIMRQLSARLIGGQTGDVAGATQQVCEAAILVGVLTAVGT